MESCTGEVMSLTKTKKYAPVLVTARCSYYDPFRSLQYNRPPSSSTTDNVRVEYSLRNRRISFFTNNTFTYAYTRDTDGNLYDFIKHT